MKRTTVVLSDPQYLAMHTLAEKRDLPFSELVRRAIDGYLLHENAISASDIDPKTFSRDIAETLETFMRWKAKAAQTPNEINNEPLPQEPDHA